MAVVGELLARLTAVPAPAGLRRLGDIAAGMLEAVPGALEQVADGRARGLVADCAAAVAEVAGEPGDRLLHWDLHYDNVLAGGAGGAGGGEPVAAVRSGWRSIRSRCPGTRGSSCCPRW